MQKQLTYSPANIKMIHDNLVNMHNQGKARDFEIKIDDLTVVQRTSDFKKFYLFQKSLTPQSNEVSFILYMGNSRRYDKYLLILNSNSGVVSKDEFQKKLSQALESQKHQMEFEKLKEKTKSQKKTIAELRSKVKFLQSKSTPDYTSLVQIIQSTFNKNGTENGTPTVNGILKNELPGMISYYRSRFGEEVFDKSLGIALKIAEHPYLIEEVKEFVETKIKEHEKSKE